LKQILEIGIKNVKGIENLKFRPNVLPNKPTIMVAPNGFGKSSLAIAFDSLKRTGISLDNNHMHVGNKNLTPEILLNFDDGNLVHNLSATNRNNNIKDMFDINVVRNSLKPVANQRTFKGHSYSQPSLNIEPIVLVQTIVHSSNDKSIC
jgi:hypothetical protein